MGRYDPDARRRFGSKVAVPVRSFKTDEAALGEGAWVTGRARDKAEGRHCDGGPLDIGRGVQVPRGDWVRGGVQVREKGAVRRKSV